MRLLGLGLALLLVSGDAWAASVVLKRSAAELYDQDMDTWTPGTATMTSRGLEFALDGGAPALLCNASAGDRLKVHKLGKEGKVLLCDGAPDVNPVVVRVEDPAAFSEIYQQLTPAKASRPKGRASDEGEQAGNGAPPKARSGQRADWGDISIWFPKGWRVMPTPQNITAMSADGQLTLLVAQHPTGGDLDGLISAGPFMPLHGSEMSSKVSSSRAPFGGSRSADFKLSPIMGDNFAMHYAVVQAGPSVMMVMGKGPMAKAAMVRQLTQSVLNSMALSGTGEQRQQVYRDEAVQQERARKQLVASIPGVWDAEAGAVDNRTTWSFWFCHDGNYVYDKVFSVVSPAIVSSNTNELHRGRWSVEEGGTVMVLTHRDGTVERLALRINQDTQGAARSLTIGNTTYGFQRRPGCHR